MILIADSGSTKSDWRLIVPSGSIYQASTEGLNPYFQDSSAFSEILKGLQTQLPAEQTEIREIFFYGAGCAATDKAELVRTALQAAFPKAQINVHTDMLGAARALCGHEAGLAAILGTGANTCYYNGETIINGRPSLGYILGDEGSGAHIGKKLVEAVLYSELPKELCDRFMERHKLSKESILDSVYRKPLPNRYLASFSKFAYQNLKDPDITALVTRCFLEFFDRQICRYENYQQLPLSFTGSVAFYYSNLLRAVALKKGVQVKTITETPIAGLTLYHLGEI